jgi:membrane fusion protein (multidrug efflux system)
MRIMVSIILGSRLNNMNNLIPTRSGIGVLAGFLLALQGCGGPDQAAMPPMPVQTVEVARMNVPLSIEMVGSTLGSQDVPIRARVEGFLEGMYFREGRFVDKGDKLYLIDQQPFLAKVAEAESNLAAAQTRHANSEADLARIRPLAEMKAVSEQDLDSAVAQEEAGRANVNAAKAQVELAMIELSYTDIRAPIDGLIGLTKARPGEFVGREPNPVVLTTLSDIDPIRVRFSISERDYLILARTYLEDKGGRTAANDRMGEEFADEDFADEEKKDLQLILADGSEHAEKGWPIASSQAINPETGTYSIEASFPNPQGLLLPGQFARVRAPYQELENVVVIPRLGIIELQGLYQVYVVTPENTVEIRSVELGPIKGNDQVIESGLEAGETIIVVGIQKVRADMVVNPTPYLPEAPRVPLQET